MGVTTMRIYIIYREDPYQGFEVRKIFSSMRAAQRFIELEPDFEKALLSIEEAFVEFDE